MEEDSNPISDWPAETGGEMHNEDHSARDRKKDTREEVSASGPKRDRRGRPSVFSPAADATHVVDSVLKSFVASGDESGKEGLQLDRFVHKVLLAGLVVSTIVIVAGLVASAVFHLQLPSTTPGLRQVFQGLRTGSPSSLLYLGILLLIATPILRVMGSVVEFAFRHDWRYVAITSLVLMILAISVVAGKG